MKLHRFDFGLLFNKSIHFMFLHIFVVVELAFFLNHEDAKGPKEHNMNFTQMWVEKQPNSNYFVFYYIYPINSLFI